MSSSSDVHRDELASLDDAIAEYFRLSQSGAEIDRDQWLKRFPQWADELRAFLASHDEMESFAGEMRRRRKSVVAVSSFGTEIKYVGEYELLEQLGQGGMGIVFKARQASLDRLVALKMLLDDSRDRNRFRAEAEAAASLEHANLVTIYEVGDHDGWPYYTMQFVDGHDLRDEVNRRSMKPMIAAKLVAKLARAVQYAHDRGVLHRDLKPANVLIDKHGEPHITDFGLAKFVADVSQATNTRTGVVLGTPSYMAPEQAAGDTTQITVGTDVYGLGSVLYALLTGQAPFTGATGLAVLRKVEREPPASPRSINRDVPGDLETICLKCLQKLPRDRYRSAEALADDLARYSAGEPILARPVNALERTWRWCLRNPAIATLSSFLILMLIGSALGGMWMARNERLAHRAAEAARAREAQARSDVEKVLVDAFVTNGRMAQQRSSHADSLLWYATAADVAKTDEQRDVNNLRVALRSEAVPLPVRAARFAGERVSILDFHPSSRYLLVGDGAGKIVCWDLAGTKRWQAIDKNELVTSARWSGNGQWLAIGTKSGEVALIELTTGSRRKLGTIQGSVNCLAVDESSNRLVAASPSEARVFSLSTELTGSEDDTDRQSAKQRFDEIWQPASGASIVYAGLNSDGDRVAIQTSDGRVNVVDIDKWPEPVFGPMKHSYQQERTDRPRPVRPLFVKPKKLILYDRPNVRIVDTDSGESIESFMIGDSRLLLVDHQHAQLLNGGARRARLWSLDGKDASSAYQHRGFVVDGDFSPSSNHLAIGSWDRRVYIWRAGSTRRVRVLPHQTRIARLCFSPCGNFLATAQLDGLVRVFGNSFTQDGRTGIRGPDGGSQGRVFRDGVVFTGGISKDSTIDSLQLINPKSQDPVGPAVDLDGTLVHADVDSSGQQALAIVKPKAAVNQEAPASELLLCDLKNGTVTRRVTSPESIRRALICADRFAVLTTTGELRWFDDQLRTIVAADAIPAVDAAEPQSTNAAPPLAKVSDSGRLLVVSRATKVSVFDVATAAPVGSTTEHRAVVTCVTLSPDDRLVASGSELGDVRISSIDTTDTIDTHLALPDFIYSINFSPDGQFVVVAGADGSARLFDVETGKLKGRPMSHENDVYDAAFSRNGKYVYTLGDNRLLCVWDARNGSFIKNYVTVSGDADARPIDRQLWLSRTPDGSRTLVCGKRESAAVYDTTPYEEEALTVDTKRQRAILELAASNRVQNATIIPIATDQWLQRWAAYCREYGTPSIEPVNGPEIILRDGGWCVVTRKVGQATADWVCACPNDGRTIGSRFALERLSHAGQSIGGSKPLGNRQDFRHAAYADHIGRLSHPTFPHRRHRFTAACGRRTKTRISAHSIATTGAYYFMGR